MVEELGHEAAVCGVMRGPGASAGSLVGRVRFGSWWDLGSWIECQPISRWGWFLIQLAARLRHNWCPKAHVGLLSEAGS